MSSKLQCPNWVPGCVKEKALELYVQIDQRPKLQAKAILERLITDPRMEGVWDELYRRTRSVDRAYFNPAIIRDASLVAWLRQEERKLRTPGRNQDIALANIREWEALDIERNLTKKPLSRVSEQPSEQDEGVLLFFKRAYESAIDNKPLLHADLTHKKKILQETSSILLKQSKKLDSVDASGHEKSGSGTVVCRL